MRRNSLRCAPFGPPTVSCVLAPARTCLRQAPPTSRGRGPATSAASGCLTTTHHTLPGQKVSTPIRNSPPTSRVSVSGVTYCNINPESYLSNFRGQCYLFTLLFLCPLVRKKIPVGFDWGPVRHFSHPVEQVGEIFKEVDAMQPAGTCQ